MISENNLQAVAVFPRTTVTVSVFLHQLHTYLTACFLRAKAATAS